MFAFLRGIVSAKGTEQIQLDVNGVGYEIFVPGSVQRRLHVDHARRLAGGPLSRIGKALVSLARLLRTLGGIESPARNTDHQPSQRQYGDGNAQSTTHPAIMHDLRASRASRACQRATAGAN